jgi:stage II sporulation protein D
MSQEGAKGFALQGYTYDQILKHYFTGVTVE